MNISLYSRNIPITKQLSIYVPTVGEVLDNIDTYYNLLSLFTATPYDLMVQLDDRGIDFSTINKFQLFQMLSLDIIKRDISLVLRDCNGLPINFANFKWKKNPENGELNLCNNDSSIVIDKAIHHQIGQALCKINFIEKKDKKPANEEAKKFLIERARIKQQRALKRNSNNIPQIEELILSMVNTREFPYDFDSVRNITIYQFNSSIRQVVKKINYDNVMIGCYAGTINIKEINPNQLNWLTNN